MTQHFDPSQKSAPNSDFDQGNVETNAVSPIDLLRDRFAGRWVISIFLALLVGTIAAVASSLLAPVYYRGQGTLQGTSVHEIIIEEIAETESATRTFDLFLMGQVELLKGRQVIRHAAESEKLEDVIKIRGFEPMLNQMEDRLAAYVLKETQLIRVQYDDPDAEVSALTTNAIIESYIELQLVPLRPSRVGHRS